VARMRQGKKKPTPDTWYYSQRTAGGGSTSSGRRRRNSPTTQAQQFQKPKGGEDEIRESGGGAGQGDKASDRGGWNQHNRRDVQKKGCKKKGLQGTKKGNRKNNVQKTRHATKATRKRTVKKTRRLWEVEGLRGRFEEGEWSGRLFCREKEARVRPPWGKKPTKKGYVRKRKPTTRKTQELPGRHLKTENCPRPT